MSVSAVVVKPPAASLPQVGGQRFPFAEADDRAWHWAWFPATGRIRLETPIGARSLACEVGSAPLRHVSECGSALVRPVGTSARLRLRSPVSRAPFPPANRRGLRSGSTPGIAGMQEMHRPENANRDSLHA